MRTSSASLSFGLILAVTALAQSVSAQPLAARVHHAQATLPDGRVLISGGERYDALVEWGAGNARALSRETWLFDPSSAAWTSAGRLVHARTGHSEIALADGRALVLGGGPREDAPDPTVEAWDAGRHTWRVVGRLQQPRFGHTATLLSDGRVLVTGGARDNLGSEVAGSNVLRSVEVWDPTSHRSTLAAPLPIALTRHAAVRLADGRVLVTGGTAWWGGGPPQGDPSSSRAFVWDPAADRWSEVGAMSGARVGHSAALLRDGRVLVVGNRVGHDASSCSWTDSDCATRRVRGDDAEVFDPRTGSFSRTGATRFPRIGDHQLAALSDGRVAVFGVLGGSCMTALQVVEAWSPATGEWSDLGDASVVAQEGFRAMPLSDGRVLLTGARAEPNRRGLLRSTASFEVWNSATASAHVPPRESTIAPSLLE